MKLAGFLLLAAGWFLVAAAVVLLRDGASRNAFIAAGIGVELLGFGLAIRSHLSQPDQGRAGRD